MKVRDCPRTAYHLMIINSLSGCFSRLQHMFIQLVSLLFRSFTRNPTRTISTNISLLLKQRTCQFRYRFILSTRGCDIPPLLWFGRCLSFSSLSNQAVQHRFHKTSSGKESPYFPLNFCNKSGLFQTITSINSNNSRSTAYLLQPHGSV